MSISIDKPTQSLKTKEQAEAQCQETKAEARAYLIEESLFHGVSRIACHLTHNMHTKPAPSQVVKDLDDWADEHGLATPPDISSPPPEVMGGLRCLDGGLYFPRTGYPI